MKKRVDRKNIQILFNRIAGHYDFLNTFLSFGFEKRWRIQFAEMSVNGSERAILDVGVGTGKTLNALREKNPEAVIVGCDFSEKMLGKAQKKFSTAGFFVTGDFHELPFAPNSFDLVTGSFVLRSVENMSRFLSEIKRILRPGGRVAFLELTRPRNFLFFKLIYQPYLRFYLPAIGGLVSGRRESYQFLSDSIRGFDDPIDFKILMEKNGFDSVIIHPLMNGIVTIIYGENRPE